MTVQMEFEYASTISALNCVQVRKGKDGSYNVISKQCDWWTEVFPKVEWVEKECVLKKKNLPYNNCYKVAIYGKVRYFFLELPEW